MLQWQRRSLENYLIDEDVIAEILKEPGVAASAVKGSGEVSVALKRLAMEHLDDVVFKEVYDGFAYESPGRRPSEITGKTVLEAAETLFGRLDKIKGQLAPLDRNEWISAFTSSYEAKKEQIRPTWDAQWRELCDGKRLFKEMQAQFGIKMSLLNFKKRVIGRMRAHPPRDNWRMVESLLNQLVARDPPPT